MSKLAILGGPAAAATLKVPDYANLFLPVAEHFCAKEQVTFPQELLLAEPNQLQLVVKAGAGELAKETQ